MKETKIPKWIKILSISTMAVCALALSFGYAPELFSNKIAFAASKKLAKGEQKLVTATVASNPAMVVSGTITKKGSKYTYEPKFIPMLRTVTEDQPSGFSQETIYRLEAIGKDGSIKKFPVGVMECVQDMCWSTGKDLLKNGTSYIDNIVIANTSNLKAINFYVKDKLVKTVKPSSKTPKVNYLTQRKGTQKVNGETHQVVFIDWDIKSSKGDHFMFAHKGTDGQWQTPMFGKVSDFKKQPYYFDTHPDYDSDTTGVTDIRVIVTDGFTSHTLEAKNVLTR